MVQKDAILSESGNFIKINPLVELVISAHLFRFPDQLSIFLQRKITETTSRKVKSQLCKIIIQIYFVRDPNLNVGREDEV